MKEPLNVFSYVPTNWFFKSLASEQIFLKLLNFKNIRLNL